RAQVGRALAGAGCVEVISSPFCAVADFDRLLLAADDRRRDAMRLANPIRDEEPLLRTTLLPGLFRVMGRNAGRGFADLALFEIGMAFLARGAARTAPILAVDRGPTSAEIAELEAALPDQPRLVSVVLTGEREASGWWGTGRAVSLHDAIQAARAVLRTSRVRYEVRAGQAEPWHPGRCAEFVLEPDQTQAGPTVIGHAGELHPRVI